METFRAYHNEIVTFVWCRGGAGAFQNEILEASGGKEKGPSARRTPAIGALRK
jgi:hypothetical protein